MEYRRLISDPPFEPPLQGDAPPWLEKGGWPCRWISILTPALPAVVAYRCHFSIDRSQTARVHVTADERYALWLDGKLIGRGSERGDPDHWFYETYDLPLSAGNHTVVAIVWSLGSFAPWAQRSVRHGLLVAPQDKAMSALLGTGVAKWESRLCDGRSFEHASATAGAVMGVGPAETIDASAFPWGVELGHGEGWLNVEAGESGNNGFTLTATRLTHRLSPATLPPMLDQPVPRIVIRRTEGIASLECHRWLSDGTSLHMPANTSAKFVIEIRPYSCFYVSLTLSGGTESRVQLCYAESPSPKTNREDISGKTFSGLIDTFLPDGGKDRAFAPLWWRCGRYIEVSIKTKAKPLTIGTLSLRETRYPMLMLPEPITDSADLNQVLSISSRTVEVCCHETYMDCPYYEQLMYIGDARIQALIGYTRSADIRPAVKALRLIDSSGMNYYGIPTDAAPGDSKFIPPFALLWIGMVHDFAMYQDQPKTIRSLMPGVRRILDRFHMWFDELSGLLRSPAGWNFIDWAADPFRYGVPPGAEAGGFSGSLNLIFLRTLEQAAELEELISEPELSARLKRIATQLAAAVRPAFFRDESNRFSECVEQDVFTEHAQALASDCLGLDVSLRQRVAQQLASDRTLVPASLYFSQYAFNALYRFGHEAALFDRLEAWNALPSEGLQTTPETLKQPRSDCHAWSAHPAYHVVASIGGIRPGSMGFKTVMVRPMLGPLNQLNVITAHPNGRIVAEYKKSARHMTVRIDLPGSLAGKFELGDEQFDLVPGLNELHLDLSRAPGAIPVDSFK